MDMAGRHLLSRASAHPANDYLLNEANHLWRTMRQRQDARGLPLAFQRTLRTHIFSLYVRPNGMVLPTWTWAHKGASLFQRARQSIKQAAGRSTSRYDKVSV